MKASNNEPYYKDNLKYSTFLDSQDASDFKKYIDYVGKYSNKNDIFLDIGCGTGIVLSGLQTKGLKVTGVDIANTSIQICLEKKLNCKVYDGGKLPFRKNSFNIVGSYNVLEHTDKPVMFLDEQIRVLRDGGILILACPNFLSITNSYHAHTRGLAQKCRNIYGLARRLFGIELEFQKMPTLERENFMPDDDACNVTNPIDILKWAKRNNLKTIYWSSKSVYSPGLNNYLDHSFFRLFLGSSFIVFKK